MSLKKQRKSTLLVTTVLATLIALPEAGYGSSRMEAARRLQEKAAADASAKAVAAEKAKAGATVVKYKDALVNPAGALAGGQPLVLALNTAIGDGGSAAHGLPILTDANKIAALEAIEGGGAGDNVHKQAIRTALGLDPDLAAPGHAAVTAEVTAFINTAKDRLVNLPGKTAKARDRKTQVAGLTQYKTALADPAAALAAGLPTSLTTILGPAVADAASAAHGLPIATDANKIAALEAIEGGGAGDNVHKQAIRTALGLDPNLAAPSHAAVTAEVMAFINTAKFETILTTIRTKLAAGTVEHLRQRRVGAGGNIPAIAMVPHPTKGEILKYLAYATATTIEDEVSTGHHIPGRPEIDAWLLAEFGIR